jgi:hypothetical protein
LPLAVLPCAHAGEPPAADEVPQHDGAVHFTQAELLSVPGTGYSAPPRRIEDAALPSEGWKTVRLPHTAGRELVPTPSGGVRDGHRLVPHRPGLVAPSAQQRLLYLPRWKTLGHIAVYGDGVLLYQSHGSPGPQRLQPSAAAAAERRGRHAVPRRRC